MPAAAPGDHGATPCFDAGVVLGAFPYRLKYGLRTGGYPAKHVVAAFFRPARLAPEVGLCGLASTEATARPVVVEACTREDERPEAGSLRNELGGSQGRR